MRFRNTEEPVYRATSTERARILFVCLGNACRSQMAEGFARAWHADILQAESAGVSPLGSVPEETAAAMAEKDVPLDGHHSKGLDAFDLRSFDIIVNMSGFPFPPSFRRSVKVIEWEVEDPFSGSERTYRKVRDEIERRVRMLADELRRFGLPA
ncbi:MAG: low molecular weight phosphatase family protein [Bryobacterales bacterium]|nr:low molecular weight phosphatase family protein [Bryobacterales bacterium]